MGSISYGGSFSLALKQNISVLVNLICHFKAIAICLYIYWMYLIIFVSLQKFYLKSIYFISSNISWNTLSQCISLENILYNNFFFNFFIYYYIIWNINSSQNTWKVFGIGWYNVNMTFYSIYILQEYRHRSYEWYGIYHMYICKVVIYNYFVLTLILYQIWLYFCSIICTLYFIWDFIVWVVCERECEDSSAYWRKCEFHGYFARSFPAKWVTCRAHDWNVKSHDNWFSRVFRE